MLTLVVQSKPFYEGAHFWEGVAAMGTFVLAFLKWAWPPIRKRWYRWRNWVLVRDGKQAIPNVSPAILAIPVRLKNLDDGQLKILDEINTYKVQHNTQVTEIAAKVDQVVESNKDLVSKVTKLFPNGENTNDPGDLLSRTAKAVGAYLDDPDPVPHDRRKGDTT